MPNLNGALECCVAELAAEILVGSCISQSHKALPEKHEYERTLTTGAEEAVCPIVERYVRNSRARLRDTGMADNLSLPRPEVGLTPSKKSGEYQVALLMSDPASGITGALWLAENAGLTKVLMARTRIF